MASVRPVTSAAPVVNQGWRTYPALYEINSWTWLSELSEKYGKTVTLASVPPVEYDGIAANSFDAVWLMGVWERSPMGIAIANRNANLLGDFRSALTDFRPVDNVGSPYCVRRYLVDEHLGGTEGLAAARSEFARRGMSLMLDFVPNHVAADHPWVAEHPEYFIRCDAESLKHDPPCHVRVGATAFACGRDPYFPAWPDVLQLNAFDPGLRRAVIDTIAGVTEQCDGIRCDMAMLLLNSVFERTWGARPGPRPASEYWAEVISAVKNAHPGFIFVAEAYWNMEWELQQLGFDFCYDKKLYDRLEHSDAESVRLHLCADLAYQGKLLRFIENHDEPRAAATFPPEKQRAVALAAATLPGIRLFHDGQFEGRKVRLPVFLGRRPPEAADRELQAFYKKLLKVLSRPAFHDGRWSLCDRTGWPDNPSFQNLVAWNWLGVDERYLIVVNLSPGPAQARVQVRWPDTGGGRWELVDELSGATYERDGDEMALRGLYVELGPWNFHLLQCRRSMKP